MRYFKKIAVKIAATLPVGLRRLRIRSRAQIPSLLILYIVTTINLSVLAVNVGSVAERVKAPFFRQLCHLTFI